MNESPSLRVLVVDDEENLRLILEKTLTSEGYEAVTAADGREGLAALDREVFDFILCDVRMPVMDGREFLTEVKARGIQAPVIMISAYGTVDLAVEAIKSGAFDYVFKPFKPDEILLTLKKAEDHQRLQRENLALRMAASQGDDSGLVARSKSMADLLVLIDRVARVKSPVLISGESGTGKELVARAIHQASDRAAKPFVAVNCGAIPENLLESELFGHVKGAFTDAASDRPGLFREADQGALFLDEVGELPPVMQVKLLRALQFEESRAVGDDSAVKVDVRIVAASARNLAEEVKAGRFREDFFYRLNVIPLHIPPLRERTDDIPPLIDHFMTAFSAQIGRERPTMSKDAAEALLSHNWPGNVRELENAIHRILVLSPKDRIDLEDIPGGINQAGVDAGSLAADGDPDRSASLDLKSGIKELEAKMIKQALIQSGGNRSEAARRLKISYPSLLSKIKAYGIDF